MTYCTDKMKRPKHSPPVGQHKYIKASQGGIEQHTAATNPSQKEPDMPLCNICKRYVRSCCTQKLRRGR